MFLYLVQHAEAKQETDDPARSLSEKGLHDIKKMGRFLDRLGLNVHKIFHSTKLRARQTAEVLAAHLKPAQGVSESDGLAPLDDPNIWFQRVQAIPENVVLVGHLPHLSRLTSLLICGDGHNDVISFRMAGVVCMKRNDDRKYMFQWMLSPEIAS